MSVTIRKKLLINFGLILAIMVVAFAFSMITTWRERTSQSRGRQRNGAVTIGRRRTLPNHAEPVCLEQLPAYG